MKLVSIEDVVSREYADKYANRLSDIRRVLTHIDFDDMTPAERHIWDIVNRED